MLLSTVLLGACWLFYRALLRQERCFQFNRRFLLYTPWAVLLLPPLLGLLSSGLSRWLPAWSTQLPTPTGLLAGGLLPTVTVRGAAGATGAAAYWPLLLYGAGVLVYVGYRSWQLLQLWQEARHWPSKIRADYTLAYTGGQRPISSFGRHIFWDETLTLSAAEAAQVLRHEEAHVRLGHSQEQLALELARALLWFNPFVHLYPAALELTHELLADEAALGQSAAAEAAKSYTALLARVALRQLHPELPLTYSFTQSFTLTRIRMLTSRSPVRRWKQWLLVPLSTALVLLAACEKGVEPTVAPVKSVTVTGDARLAPPPPPPAYFYVEHMPEYPGGPDQLLTDIGKLVEYPAIAKEEKLEGRVFVRFIVATDGTLQAAEIQKGIGHNLTVPADGGKPIMTKLVTPAAQALNDMALNAVRNLPGKWKPGTQDGKPVAVFFTVPITFALN